MKIEITYVGAITKKFNKRSTAIKFLKSNDFTYILSVSECEKNIRINVPFEDIEKLLNYFSGAQKRL